MQITETVKTSLRSKNLIFFLIKFNKRNYKNYIFDVFTAFHLQVNLAHSNNGIESVTQTLIF